MNVIFYLNDNGRARHVCEAFESGCRRHGQAMRVKRVTAYRAPEADVAVFYGLWEQLRTIHRDYIAAGRKAVLVDLGYWGRVWNGDKLAGYHRLVVNGLHATGYFQRLRHVPERFNRFNIRRRKFAPRGGGHVLLCGMSAKAAWVYGMEPQEWERRAVEVLKRHTDREIRYRPKQSWKDATPIEGTTWSPDQDLLGPAQLAGCSAVVTHHGNSALDALIEGVPVFAIDGIASALADSDLARIETPGLPGEDERDQLLFDAAWTQWRIPEIRDGSAWQYLRDEGLL